MQESFFTRSEWLGIELTDLGVPLDPARPATPAFYEALYAELRERHSSVEEFPAGLRATKQDTAAVLAELIRPEERVLSFGAGIGYVEWLLMQQYGIEQIHLWDAASAADRFVPEVRDRYLPGRSWPEPVDDRRFDVICLVQVLYALDHVGAVDTLSRLRDLAAPGGRLIVIEGSAVPAENGASEDTPRPSRTTSWVTTDEDGGPAPDGHQGWGWLRDNARVHALCTRAGMTSTRSFPAAGQSVTVAIA